MNTTETTVSDLDMGYDVYDSYMPSSAVAWSAIFGGAIIATVVSLALLLLGSSLGLAVVSPWSDDNTSIAALSFGAIAWMVIMQWSSAALGGYITGRMRTRWNYAHDDEVFFRDTAHGFLTWAVATLITVVVFGSAVTSLLGAGTEAATAVAAGAAAGEASDATSTNPVDLYIDSLYRSATPTTSDRDVRAETSRLILSHMGTDSKSFSEEDKDYLSDLIARRAGVSGAEADRRVDVLINDMDKAKAAADAARKAAAKLAIWTFISMVFGAFIASVAAAIGGRERDYIS